MKRGMVIRMKRFLIRSAVFVAVFIAAVFVTSRILNKDHNNMTREMAEASLPLLSMVYEGQQYNRLIGYTVPMDPAAQRGSLTILGENRSTGVLVENAGLEPSGIQVEVRSTDGSRLIERVEPKGMVREEERLWFEVELKDLILQGQEYLLVFLLELEDGRSVRYYTRAVWDPRLPIEEDMAFVQDFHEKLYHREEAKELVKYLETNSKLEDNTSFHKVNIHSSFKQLTWGDLQVTEVGTPVYTLRELTDQAGSILVDYYVSVAGETRSSYYQVQEYYRVRYTPDRMYLLDYERTMTQIPEEDALYAGDKLLLGIAPQNGEMMENEDGSVVAFAQADRLFSYNSTTGKLARIFSFYDEQHQDPRDLTGEHEIRILRVSPEGDVIFGVYGYMNRGTHEGENGLLVSQYNTALNVVEELAFIPWDQSYYAMRPQLEELLYLGEEGQLYLSMNNRVCRVDLQQGSCQVMFDIAWDGCMQVSGDHRILVWQEREESGFPGDIFIRNLETDAQARIEAKQGEVLQIMGFMGEDVIYGAVRKEEITRQSTGELLSPMYKLGICNSEGELLKEYAQDNIYVTGCYVEENQITLERAERRENGTFADIGEDHITKTQQLTSTQNKIVTVDIDRYKRYVQIQVKGKIDPEKVQLLTPLEMVREGASALELQIESPVERYFVYGPYGVEGIYTSMGNAVNHGYEISGAVISEGGDTLWMKGKRATRNQIMAIKEPEKTSEEESLAVCLDTMMSYKGISVSSASLLAQGKYPQEILEENMTDVSALDMTGCTLDAMLYYVNLDIPVLAILESGEAVLVTGFNESQVVIFQPAKGKLYKRGMKDCSQWFAENGNCFLIYSP